MATPATLHPTMTQDDMNKMLSAAFGIKSNPYTVEQLFDAARVASA